MTLFRGKFACNLAISNPVFRWKSCKGRVWESVKKCSRLWSEARTLDWISRVARGLQAAKRCTRVKHAEKLNCHASCRSLHFHDQNKSSQVICYSLRRWNAQFHHWLQTKILSLQRTCDLYFLWLNHILYISWTIW